jgi:hypothetical protein
LPAKLLARDNATKFATKHQGWVYEISDWKAKNLTKELSDLIEDEEEPKEEEDGAEDPNTVTLDETAAPTSADPNTPEVEDANTLAVEDPNTPNTEDPNAAKTEP